MMLIFFRRAKVQNLMSPDAFSKAPKCSEMRSQPESHWGSSQRSPRSPSCIEGAYLCEIGTQGKEMDRRKGDWTRGEKQEGREREERREERTGGPERFSCRGMAKFEVTPLLYAAVSVQMLAALLLIYCHCVWSQFFVSSSSLCDWLQSSMQLLQQPLDNNFCSADDLEQFAMKLLVSCVAFYSHF